MPQVGIQSRCLRSLDGLAYSASGRDLRIGSAFSDLLGGISSDMSPWYTVANGAGAAVNYNNGTVQRPGQLAPSTGTTAAGRAGIYSNVYSFLFGGGEYSFETEVNLPLLSTAAEEFCCYYGFGDVLTGDQVDGAYFKYDRTVSLNWLLCTANNSARTVVDSGVAVTAGAWVKFKVAVNAAGTLVSFYINGTLVGTINTNIPTAAFRDFGTVSTIVKSVGLTARTFLADWVWFHYALTASR